MQRLFVAIDFPEYVRNSLATLVEDMRGVSWSLSVNLHLTLMFLGETEPERISIVQGALRDIDVSPFFLPIKGIGVFPNKGEPRVLWAGLANGHPHLFQLQHRITDALFNLGFDPGDRAWQPHITLARCGGASEETIRQYLKKHREYETAPVKISEFHLFASERQGGKRFYPLVETFTLQGTNQTLTP